MPLSESVVRVEDPKPKTFARRERRHKILSIPVEAMLERLFAWPDQDCYLVFGAPGLPDDCEVVRAKLDELNKKYLFVLYHPSFEIVPEAEVTPRFDGQVTVASRRVPEEIRRLQGQVQALRKNRDAAMVADVGAFQKAEDAFRKAAAHIRAMSLDSGYWLDTRYQGFLNGHATDTKGRFLFQCRECRWIGTCRVCGNCGARYESISKLRVRDHIHAPAGNARAALCGHQGKQLFEPNKARSALIAMPEHGELVTCHECLALRELALRAAEVAATPPVASTPVENPLNKARRWAWEPGA